MSTPRSWLVALFAAGFLAALVVRADAATCSSAPAWGAGASLTNGERFDHSAVWDPINSRMVVFGGRNSSSGFLDDVWAYVPSTNTWTNLTPAVGGPLARRSHTAIYDSARQRMVVFGGMTASGQRNDVWALNLTGTPAWTQIVPSGTCATRYEHVAIYDTPRDRMVVFGGAPLEGTAVALSFASNQWTQLSSGGPIAMDGCAAIYDPVGQRMILYGGTAYCSCICPSSTYVTSNEALALSMTVPNPSWTSLGFGPPLDEPAAVYDPQCQRMVIVGGHTQDGCVLGGGGGCTLRLYQEFPTATVAYLSLSGTPTFSYPSPTGVAMTARGHHSAVLDPGPDHRIHVFGGGRYWQTGSFCTITNNFTFLNTTPRLTLPDVIAPAGVTNLSRTMYKNGATLSWMAPGDDGATGTVASYTVKYHTSALTAANFDNTGVTMTAPAPLPAGTTQVACVDGLPSGITYWFALKSTDDAGNLSVISNVISGTTRTIGASILCDGFRAQQPVAEVDVTEFSIAGHPNPMDGRLHITLSVPVELEGASIDVSVFDLLGRRVRQLLAGSAEAGRLDGEWDRSAEDGAPASPGIYFLRARVGDQQRTRTIQLR